MWLIEQLWKAIAGDRDPLPPTADEFGDDPVSAAFVDAIRERKAFRNRAFALERELRNRGMDARAINALVEMYERGLRAEANVRAR